jgi:hypothetical protein
MATISCDRPTSWNNPAYARTATERQVPKSDPAIEAATEWEFSEAMRSPHFSAGWFLLPSAGLATIFLLAFLL